jgi:biopolymer transport protein TolR
MAQSLRGSSMRSGRMRRSMSDINVVPYIDVMLVLLVIFMVTAPLVNPGTIDLPSVAKSSLASAQVPIEVIIRADKTMSIRIRDPKAPVERSITQAELPAFVTAHQAKTQTGGPTPVVISADKTVQYDTVLQVMDSLQRQNIQRIGLAVKPAQ